MLLDDAPLSPDKVADVGWSEFDTLAQNIATSLPKLPPTSPMLLTGDWGAGKTTMLKFVQEALAPTSRSTASLLGHPPVFFDAWLGEHRGGILPAFYEALVQAAGILGTIRASGIQASRQTARVQKGALLLRRALEAALDPGATLRALSKDAASVNPQSNLIDAANDFVRAAWPERPPIVLIDDLDRCSPETVVILVEQIRHLVYRASESGLRFILAVDRDIVTRAVAQKYQGIDDFDANRYLEKIFPLSVRVPSPGAAMPQVVRHFIETIDEDRGRHYLTPEVREHLRTVFADELFANPRLLKRCLNRYLLYREWGGAELPEEDALLAIKWLAATDRWPDLRRVFRRFKRDYWERIARATLLDRTDMPGPEAEKLRKSTGLLTWLRNEGIIQSQTDGPRLGPAYDRLKGIDTAFMERGQ